MPNTMKKHFLPFVVVLCLMLIFSVSALAAYSNVYGLTTTRIRVRDSASTSSAVFDNIEQDRLVYVDESKDSGGTTFLHVRYRTLEGKNGNGWIALKSGGSTYVEILSDERAQNEYNVSGGKLPAAAAGTKSASEREALRSKTSDQPTAAPAAPAESAPLSGTSDAAIRDVQEKLKAIGFYSGDITGRAGEKTIQAIKAFQKKIGLDETGELTKTTLARLDEHYAALRQNQREKADTEETGNANAGVSARTIEQVQTKLKALDFYSGDITGKVGEKTTSAIITFQTRYGLSPDGIIGKATLTKLDEVYNARQSSDSLTAPETTATTAAAPSADSGTIRQVQEKLKTLGFYSGEVTGNAGSKTTAAIKAFQQKYGLTADGIPGSATLRKLDEVLAGASDSSSAKPTESTSAPSADSGTIRQVQEKLKTLGFYSGEVTGNAGSKTTAAIKAFQQKYGLTADGIPGSATLRKLDEVLADASDNSSAESTSVPSVSSGTIRQVQEKLKALGLYSGEVTGNAGSKTTAAIKAFQQKYGLTADGIPGNATLRKLDEVYSSQGSKEKEADKPDESASLPSDTVRQLQEKLKALGFYSGEITGKIGSKTTAAVKAFQQKYGLTADGIPGSATLKKLDEVYKNRSSSSSGSSSASASAIKNAQKKLKELGFYSGEVTGSIGAKTTAAIRAFQKKYGLTADGILGSGTIAKINSVYKASSASKTSSGSSSSSGHRQIYNLDWFTAKNNKLLGHLGLSKGHTVRLTDLNSGKSLDVAIQSAGNHLDVEPMTKEDTETFLSIYHVSSASKITFIRRAGLITTEYGYRIVCSFYGQPHGSQLIHTNNFNGQFCIHFLHSKTHGSNVVDGDHQACIRKAVAHYGSSNVKVIRTEDDL
ncbi:MAG: peptidoglycan-binding protein [Clostridia bacterium]|nr:peptidoglycan-binding protein [Clostridia bacterium]